MKLFKEKEKIIKPLPFSTYFWTVFVIALIGLIDSAYLAFSHYRMYTDVWYKSFCSVSKSVNCDTVSQSSYSIFLGMPVPIWGVIGYLFFIIVLCFAFRRDAENKRLWLLLFVISFGYSIYSIILAYISAAYIHSYCFMCILSYGVNFLLVYFTWLIRKRFESTGFLYGLKEDIKYVNRKKSNFISAVAGILLGIFLLITFLPDYWDMKPPVITREISSGITPDGHPWIGAEDTEIEIVEFTDYMCFQCRKMHFFLRKLIEKNPKKIRLVHRQFPMDHQVNPFVKEPLHIGTGGMAIFAIYAASKGKFWMMNDILFNIDRRSKKIDLKMLARLSGTDVKELSASIYNPEFRNALHSDIMYGLKNGIIGTPSYIINGEVYRGQIPEEIINRLTNNK